MTNAVVAKFNKHFVKGNLEGLDSFHSLEFVSPESARSWYDGVAKNIRKGNLDYTLTEFWIERKF